MCEVVVKFKCRCCRGACALFCVSVCMSVRSKSTLCTMLALTIVSTAPPALATFFSTINQHLNTSTHNPTTAQQSENMTSNAEMRSKYTSVEEAEDDFM